MPPVFPGRCPLFLRHYVQTHDDAVRLGSRIDFVGVFFEHGNKIPIALSFGLRLVLWLLILSHQNLYTFYIFAAMFGFTFLITAPLTTTLVGKLYGFSHIGLISGFITMVHHMGGGLWAYIGGWSFDTSGSYRWAFIGSAVMAGIALIGTLMIKEKPQF